MELQTQELREADAERAEQIVSYGAPFLQVSVRFWRIKENTEHRESYYGRRQSAEFRDLLLRSLPSVFLPQLVQTVKGSVVAEPSSKKLDVKMIDTLLNEMFNTRTRQNERILNAFILQHDIEFDGEKASSPTKRWSQNQKIKPPVKLIFLL